VCGLFVNFFCFKKRKQKTEENKRRISGLFIFLQKIAINCQHLAIEPKMR
jgi:hypothetical protein